MIGLKQTAQVVLWAAFLILGNIAAQAGESVGTAEPRGPDDTPRTTYVVGDIGPHGGKVFYVDASGRHGLEAKAADEINSLIWSEAVQAASAHGFGWRLPTKTELKILYEQKKVVGGFAKDDYWSSTELDSNSAWIQGFVNGDQDRYSKYSSLRVRAVRTF